MAKPELSHRHEFRRPVDLSKRGRRNGLAHLVERLDRYEASRCGCGVSRVSFSVARGRHLSNRQMATLATQGQTKEGVT